MKLVHWGWVLLFLDLCAFTLYSGSNFRGADYAHGYRILMVSASGLLLLAALIQQPMSIASLFKGVLGLYALFALFALFSTIYSSHPSYTAWKGIELFLLGVSIAILVRMKNNWEEMKLAYLLTINLLTIVLLLAWLYALIFPGESFQKHASALGFMMGGLLNPNALGSISAMIGIHHFAKITKKGSISITNIFFLILSVSTIILAYSRTSLIGFFIAITIFCFIGRKIKLTIVLIVMMLVIAFSVSMTKDVGSYLSRGQSAGALEGMSGRRATWGYAFEYWKKSPYIGHGHMSAGRYDVLRNTSSHLHGSPVEVLVGLGGFGLFFWFSFILLTGIKIFKKNIFSRKAALEPAYDELLAVYVFLVLRSFTSSILAMHSMEMMLFACLIGFAMVSATNNNVTE